MKKTNPNHEANRFNAANKVGQLVHYWTGARVGPGKLGILADYLGAAPKRIQAAWSKAFGFDNVNGPAGQALKLHQLFKADFIAKRRLEVGQSYEILGAEIASWIGDQQKPTG